MSTILRRAAAQPSDGYRDGKSWNIWLIPDRDFYYVTVGTLFYDESSGIMTSCAVCGLVDLGMEECPDTHSKRLTCQDAASLTSDPEACGPLPLAGLAQETRSLATDSLPSSVCLSGTATSLRGGVGAYYFNLLQCDARGTLADPGSCFPPQPRCQRLRRMELVGEGGGVATPVRP